AARRNAVPHAVLPDLPEGGLGDRRPGELGADAEDAGTARRGPRARRPLPGRARGLPRPAGQGRRGGGPGAAAGGHAERGRHADPGEVPARAGRARARRTGDQPVRAGGARHAPRVVGEGPLRAGARAGEGGRMRVAAVDCGTNSVRLLIADVAGGGLTDVERRMEIVRLGEGVDRTGRLAPEALARTFTAMRGYAKLIAEHADGGPTPVRVVATSATRDAVNRDEFTAGVREIFGVDPEVVSGDEEARLSFAGATGDLPPGLAEPYLVVDIDRKSG